MKITRVPPRPQVPEFDLRLTGPELRTLLGIAKASQAVAGAVKHYDPEQHYDDTRTFLLDIRKAAEDELLP